MLFANKITAVCIRHEIFPVAGEVQWIMEGRSYERIRFSIKGPDGTYRGEVVGDELRENARYSVRLATGETFEIEAVSKDDDNYKWIAQARESAAHLVPVVGGIIERYFKRKQKNEE